ncbi:MAG: sigma-70 family RNA polymerase sigma factor [Actinomycetota bacterium]|nr:sigma-70 family RNA polymerase sigma factor [Actinomycetota bacterium]
MSQLLSRSEEQALVSRAKSGDRVAYETLVRHNADRLYAVVLRFSATEADAEEATQEAFLRAWRSIGRFRGDARFFTWLYRIGVNEAKRMLDRRPGAQVEVSTEDRPIDDVADDAPQVHVQAEVAELRLMLERAIRRLPEKYRAAVVLRDVEGLSTSEAADALGLREAAFKSRLHRGRMALRTAVAHYVSDDDELVPEAPGTELS